MSKRGVVPRAIGPGGLSGCELGSREHMFELLAKLVRFTNLHIQYNHHRQQKWVRLLIPTCFDESDEFIRELRQHYCEQFEVEGWRVHVYFDKRVCTGTWVFLIVPGSPGEKEFDERIENAAQHQESEG